MKLNAEPVRPQWGLPGMKYLPPQTAHHQAFCVTFRGDTFLPPFLLLLNPSETDKSSVPDTPSHSRTWTLSSHLLAGGDSGYLHFILHKIDTVVPKTSPPRLPVQNVVKISGLKMDSLRFQRLVAWLSF